MKENRIKRNIVMQTEILKVIGMTCGGCIGNATHALKPINDVGHVDVSLAAGEATDTSYLERPPRAVTQMHWTP